MISSSPTEIRTGAENLVLRQFGPEDADAYYALAQRNLAHLSRHGDEWPEQSLSLDESRALFASYPDASARFGLFLAEELVGRVDVVHRVPPAWGFGYWLSEHVTGRGLMTAACRAALDYARDSLRAEEVLAGVSHGNVTSVAVLERCGFEDIERFDTYSRFKVILRR